MTDTTKKPRPPITILEPMRANNVTAEERTWPIAEFGSYGGVAIPASDLTRELAARIVAAPPERRAEMLSDLNAEIVRALAAATPAA